MSTTPHVEAIRALAAMRGEPWAIQPEAMSAVRVALAAVAAGDQPPQHTAFIDDEDADGQEATRGGVRIVPLTGIITPTGGFLARLFGLGGGLQEFRASMRDALDDDDISAIVIHVDSPGGRSALVAEVAAEVRAMRGRKPIVAVASTLAASAAYWIASQADEVVITPSGFAGSIGVVATHEDISKLEEQLGIKTTLIYAGEFKVEGNPFEPLSDEARAAIQAEVDITYDRFVSDVAAGRGASTDDVRAGYGEGRVLSAERALDAGLVDRIETIDETVQRLVGAPPAAESSSQSAQLTPHLAALLTARPRFL